jgi:hypothetical protein
MQGGSVFRWGKRPGLVVCLTLPLPAAAAELPNFYREVDRVFWVVDDIDLTIDGWQKLGIIEGAR